MTSALSTDRRNSLGRVFVLINAQAGQCDPDELGPLIRQRLNDADIEHDICITRKGKRKKSRRAISDGCDTIIAVGGDGTVSKVAGEIVGSNVALGIVPAGTGNLIARELELPLDCTDAVDLIVRSQQTRHIDAMKINDVHDFSHISLGTYSRITKNEDEQSKERFGRAAYLWQMLKEIGTGQHWTFHISADGQDQQVDASLILVANTGQVGVAGMEWGEQIAIDDGRINVCIVRAHTLGEHAGLVWHAMIEDANESPQIAYLSARETIVIQCADASMPVRADGKVIGEGSVEINVVPGCVRVFV